MKLDDAVKKELLDLSTKTGNAQKALDLFLKIASPAFDAMKVDNTLLGMIYKSRKDKSGHLTIHTTKYNEKELFKAYSSLCLKIVQNILKAYVSLGKDASKEDICNAMDLATISLSLLIKFEKQIRIGELVIENMLYQIAKKYIEIPKRNSSAVCVLACIHLRVWDFHGNLCAQLNQENAQTDLMEKFREKKIKLDVHHIDVICQYPQPQSFHSALYARLLIGVLNTALTMLHNLQEHQMLLELAKAEFRPWLDYLASTPGIDKKVIVSNNDRMFRIFWKCAATVEKQKEASMDEALVYRSAALEYMARCPTYTNSYCLQQIYRVGLQHERCIHQSSKSGSSSALYGFYIRSFELLKLSENLSKDVNPDFVMWMEHFASTSEKLKYFSDQIVLLDTQLRYLEGFQNTELWKLPAELSLSILLAEISLNKKQLKRSEYSKRICKLYPRVPDNASCMDDIKPSYRPILNILLDKITQEKRTPENCLTVAKAIFSEIVRLDISKAVSNSSANSKVIPFLLRLMKRSVMSLYNLASEHLGKMEFHTLISHVARLFEMMRSSLDSSSITDLKSLAVSEVRFRRLAVSLGMKSYCNFSKSSTVKYVDLLREHKGALYRLSFFEELDPTMKDDIHAVVREIYSTGFRLHKEKAMDECVAITTLALDLLSYEGEQLKTGESIYTLLSYSLRELSNLPQSRRMLINALGFSDESVPVRNIEKLVGMLVEESFILDQSSFQSYVADVKTCLSDLLGVFNKRQIPITFQQDVLMYLQYSLEQSCHRIVTQLRTSTSSNRINTESTSNLRGLEALILVQNEIWAFILEGSDSNPRFLLQSALGKRLCTYGSYYCQKQPNFFREECASIIETLRGIAKGTNLDKRNMIRAEASTWRTVMVLEMALVLNYTGEVGTNPTLFDELCQNVTFWRNVIDKQQLDSRFGDQCIRALQAFAACLGALNLPEMESQVQEIESQIRQRVDINVPCVHFPIYFTMPFCRLNSCKPIDPDHNEMGGFKQNESNNETVSQLQRIDYLLHESSEMLYGKKTATPFNDHHDLLKEVIEALEFLKSKHPHVNQNLAFYKAICMREIMVHVSLSNVHFDRGDWQRAAEEAKMALALVWKLARKFCHESTKGEKTGTNISHFIIPDEMLARSISHSVHSDESRKLMQSKNKALIYFQAQEYELWEILQVTRYILSYLGDIYSLAGNVYKSTTYFSEALSLAGGLHSLSFLHNQVVLEYSRFHLQCERNIQAKRTLDILDKNYRNEVSAQYLASIENFVALRVQYCIEMIQRADIQNKAADAISFYAKGLAVLDELPSSSKQCHRRVEIYRKLVKTLYAQYEDSNQNDNTVRQSLVMYLGELKSLLKKCEDKIERCMGICELARINLLLSCKNNTENIMSLEECITILEEAFDISSTLGVLYIQQYTRKVLGVGYHLKIERQSSASSSEGNELRFSCASLMSNIFYHTERNINPSLQSKEQDIYARLQLLSLSEQGKKSKGLLDEWVHNTREKILSDALPSNWNVVSISTGLERDQLMITKITKGKIPVCFKLDNMPWKKWVDEMNAILKESKKSLLGASSDESLGWSNDQKKDWWDLRKELDERLGRLIKQIELNLGIWKCLLVPQKSPSETSFVECLTEECKKLTYEQMELLEYLVMNSDMDEKEKIQGFRWIFPSLSPAEVEEVIVALKSSSVLMNGSSESHIKPCKSPTSQKHEYLMSLTQENLNRMKVPDLKAIATSLNIDSSGIKKNIIERIMEARNNTMLRKLSDQKTNNEQVQNAPLYQGATTILILDTLLQEIPWEGLDGLKKYAVTRMPSLQLLLEKCIEIENKSSTKVLRRNKVSYVLNPSGDLSTTEKSLHPILHSASMQYGWKGVIGKPPDVQEMRNYLLKSDLFIYCGHGAGEKYFHRDQILKLQGNSCSAAFLFGCSSGRLEKEGIFGPNGTVLSYLAVGSPTVLAMLWDVTDRDVDRLSLRILEDWVLAKEEKHDICLGEMLQQSRSVCKLKNLNGLAAVCYGIPVRMTL